MPLEELPLAEDAAVTLILRQNQLVPPRSLIMLQPGDHVRVIARPRIGVHTNTNSAL